MYFELVSGSLIATLGLAGMLLAWLHPSPGKLRFVKGVVGPGVELDRVNIALSSLSCVAIAMLFFADLLGGGLKWNLIWFAVIAAACVGLGLRREAV